MKPTVWEYRIEYRSGGNDLLKELNDDMGPNGWELCGVVGAPDEGSELGTGWPRCVRYYFKRPNQEGPKKKPK